MRYDEYQNKMKKAAGVKKFLYRFRFLFISVISVIAVIGIVLFNTKGLITSSTPISQMQYYYGQDIQYNISGFLTSQDEVGLEFQVDGQWTVEAPNKPGNYSVRPYSTNNYGGKIYGNTQTITISPKPVELSIKSNSINYGEKPEINILDEDGKDGLVSGDTLTYDVKYTNLSSSDTPDCYVDLVNVKVEDPKGRDVTECYSFTTPASSVRINKRTLVFNPAKTSLIYDGKTHDTSDDIERIKEGKFDNETSLIDGDKVESFPSPYQFFNASSQSYTYEGKDFKIVNSDGVDVTRHYSLTIGNGEFDIKPAELVINSGSVNKVYDGAPIEVPDPKVDETTPLQGNDVLKIVNHPVSPFYKVGSQDNTFEFDIVDKDNPEISHKGNYHITVNTGKLTITKAPAVHVNVSKKDAFVNKYVSDFEVKNENLVDYLTFHTSNLKGNDKLTYDKTKKNYAQEDTPTYTYDVESNTYKLEQPSLHIFHEDREDVTDCYESVSFSDGHQNITDVKKKKIEINLSLPKKEYEYKGAPVFKENDLQKVVTGNDEGLNVVLVKDSYSIPTDYREEAYHIDPKFCLMKGSEDVTDYYDVEVHPFEVKVKQKELWIDIDIKENGDSLSKTYDGNEIVPVFKVTGLLSNDVDGVHHHAQVSFNDREYGFNDRQADEGTKDQFSLNLNIKDVGKYAFKDMNDEEVDAYLKRLLEWHIYDSIGTSAKDVTSNYNVHFGYEDKTISIEKKHIEIKFENMIHYYDRKPFSAKELADNYTIVGGNTLAAGHTLKIDLDKDYEDIGTYSDFQNHISRIDVYDAKGAIVTDNYDIDYRSNVFSLTIKKVKIVYTLKGTNSIYTDPETHIQSVAYGSEADKMNYGNGSIDFASSSDFESDYGNKNELEKHYHLGTGYKLKAKNPDDNTLDGVYKLTMEEFNLTPDETYLGYGYGAIDASMIDFTMDGLDGNELKIHRRQLNLKVTKTELKFLYNGVEGIDKSGFEFLKQKYLICNLALGDTLSISWKTEYQDGLKIDGDYANFNDKRFENIQNMIDIRILNKDGKDVTNYYSKDRDGKDGYDNNVPDKELKIEESISVTYEKPRVSLSLDGAEDKKTIQAYDSMKSPSTLFKASLDNVLDDGEQSPDIKIEVSQPKDYNTNRVGEYRFHVDEVSFEWNGFKFSWGDGSIVCEGKKDFTLYVNRLMLSISRPSEEQVYWQDGKELTLEEPSSGEKDPGKAYLYKRYAGYFKGLHSGDTIHFERIPGSSLPKEASIDAYSLLDCYRITVRHSDPNNSIGFEDVTDNYEISEKEDSEQTTHLEDYLWKFDESTLSYKRTEEESFERFYIYRFAGSLSYEFNGNDGNSFFKTDRPISSGRYICSFTSDMPDSILVDPSAFHLEFEKKNETSADPYDETTFGTKYTKVKKVTYDVSVLYGTCLNDDSILKWEDGGTSNSIDLTIQNSYFNVIRTPVTIDVSNVRLTTLHEDVSKKPSEIKLTVKDVVSIDGQLNKNNVTVSLKDTVELSADKENNITGDDVDVSLSSEYNIGDYNIKVNDFKLTYEKPTLKITMNKGDWCEYDGESHKPSYSVGLYGLNGKELSKKDFIVSLGNVKYNKYVTDVGSYTGFEITDFTVKVNQTTYSKDDFNVQYLNQNDAVYEVRKRKLTVTGMKSCKVGEEYSGLSTLEIARRLKEEIKKKPNDYFSCSQLVSGHSLSDFDVSVTVINNAYYYTITPTKIVDVSGNDVTYFYEMSPSTKAPLIIQMSVSDDDFE